MKTKEIQDQQKSLPLEKTTPANRPKSLRPSRSMVAVRSLRPKTTVAVMNLKSEEVVNRA